MKKKIALMANGWNGENLDNFIAGLRDVFDNGVADIFVFASHATYAMSEAMRRVDNSIYTMPDYGFFDGVILFGSGMNSDESVQLILNRCKEADVPVVLQGIEEKGYSSVTVDNYAGMRSLCDHLIEKHQVKDVIFIGGPKDNDDSNLRKRALSEALEAHGYALDESQVVYANWERRLVQDYVTEKYSNGEPLPDAFVCANDVMALFLNFSLEVLGIKVPDDVLVTGFDNLSEGRVFYPSLASVDQRYREQGNDCARFILQLCEDRQNVTQEVLPCLAEAGESCGCYHCKNEELYSRMYVHDHLKSKFDGDRFRSRQSRIEMCIMSSTEYRNIPERIQKEFYQFFCGSAIWDDTLHICINPAYKELAYMKDVEREFPIEGYSPVMDVLTSRTDGVVTDQKTVNTKELMAGYQCQGEGKLYVFCPFGIGEMLAGYMVLGHVQGMFNDHKYYDFRGTVATALEKYQSNIKMCRLNEKLSELMEKDSLTSVKNRIAYDSYMKNMDHMEMEEERQQISIVVCDINNLKTINDHHGHDAGDIYIQNCCRLMSETFGNSAIYRTGGDEFVILISNEDFNDRYERLGSMRLKMRELAASDASPISKVSVATGLSDFDPATDSSLLDVVRRADSMMYINKAEMKYH